MDKKQLIRDLNNIITKLFEDKDLSTYGLNVMQGFVIDVENRLVLAVEELA